MADVELIDDGRRDKTKREDLDQMARDEGIENPEQFETKADVVDAINAARKASAKTASETEKPKTEREDDEALRAGDTLDRGLPPTAEEIEKASKQAMKDAATLAQEQADAILRQGATGVGGEFQPPEGQKPVFVQRGRHVNPDGKVATRRNLMLNEDGED